MGLYSVTFVRHHCATSRLELSIAPTPDEGVAPARDVFILEVVLDVDAAHGRRACFVQGGVVRAGVVRVDALGATHGRRDVEPGGLAAVLDQPHRLGPKLRRIWRS